MLEQIFKALGYLYTPYDGSYRWSAEVPPVALLEAVEGLPGDETGFRSVNLMTDPAGLALAAIATLDQFSSVKALQCGLIRRLRQEAYKEEADSLFFSHEADGDSVDAWLNKRAEIKARFPWPGEYR